MFNTLTFQFGNESQDTTLHFLKSLNENFEVKVFIDPENESKKLVRAFIPENPTNSQLFEFGERLASDITSNFSVVSDFEVNYQPIIESMLLALTPINIFTKGFKFPEPIQVEASYEFETAYADALIAATNYNIARVLNNLPYNKCNPELIINYIENIFNHSSVNVSILGEKQCIDQKMAGMLSLAKGSKYEPQIVKIEYNNADLGNIALVGKGIMFDTGGYSIKSGRDLSYMKTDMGGVSSVIGGIKQLADTHAKVNVTGYLMITDNMINENAMLPGDVIEYRNGLSVEVGNTDAEGRLILADGMLLAEAEGAEEIITVATLTGNIGSALGTKYAGVFTKYEKNYELLKTVGQASNELVWQMPMEDEYVKTLKGNITDLRNISSMSNAGAITAALFLNHFVNKSEYMHIDIAYTVDRPIYGAKYSGYGVRLLSKYVIEKQMRND